MSVVVRRTSGDDSDAVALVARMTAEVRELYGGDDMPPGSAVSAAQMSRPGGGFVVLEEDGRALAGGGVKRLDERIGEIKRMYVAPEARGRGLGRVLLAALEDLVRDLGYEVARLDTGAKQPRAKLMYERAGYTEIPDYNGNPDAAYWGEKRV